MLQKRNNSPIVSRRTFGIMLLSLVVVLLAGGIGWLVLTGVDRDLRRNAQRNMEHDQSVIVSPSTHAGAAIVDASPTTEGVQKNPYPPYQGRLVLDTPLHDHNSSGKWEVSTAPNQGNACVFKDSAYHLTTALPQSSFVCPAFSTDFADFTYEVEMTILKGDGGGIVFRSENLRIPSLTYCFHITTQGHYQLEINDRSQKILSRGVSSAIHVVPGQANLLAVAARGDRFDVYINHQVVTSARDSTAARGQIGVVVEEEHTITEVAFRNAKVWILP